jgi:hypothetical protein
MDKGMKTTTINHMHVIADTGLFTLKPTKEDLIWAFLSVFAGAYKCTPAERN